MARRAEARRDCAAGAGSARPPGRSISNTVLVGAPPARSARNSSMPFTAASGAPKPARALDQLRRRPACRSSVSSMIRNSSARVREAPEQRGVARVADQVFAADRAAHGLELAVFDHHHHDVPVGRLPARGTGSGAVSGGAGAAPPKDARLRARRAARSSAKASSIGTSIALARPAAASRARSSAASVAHAAVMRARLVGHEVARSSFGAASLPSSCAKPLARLDHHVVGGQVARRDRRSPKPLIET